MYKAKRSFKRLKLKNLYIGNGITLDERGDRRIGCINCGSPYNISYSSETIRESICRDCQKVENNKRLYMRNWR